MGFQAQKNTRFSPSLLLFLVFLLAIIFLEKSVGVISALEYSNDKQPSRFRLMKIQKYLAKINKPAVLSINSPDGDIIDCVDKWKQPAFDHPLLKNHTLRSAPTKLQFRKENGNGGEEIEFSKRAPMQVWHLNGTWCPKNTVAIRRTTVKDVLMTKYLHDFMRKRPNRGSTRNNMTASPNDDDPSLHEHAVARGVLTENVFGIGATINIWNPSVSGPGEFSLAQLWLTHWKQNLDELYSIEVGWQVYPGRYNSPETRLFMYLTRDGYKTGCYNLKCTEFVQTDNFIVPGATMLTPYSTIDGPQYDAGFEISEDFGDWWIKFTGSDSITHEVGYFPWDVLPLMKDGATGADWGGEVINIGRRQKRGHTRTQMGSGRFAEEGLGRAAYFRNLFVVTDRGNTIHPETTVVATNPNCYTVTTPTWDDSSPAMGLHFYYGGPGGAAPNCHN